jgi:iron complex transport system ATP-binding protein
MISCRGLSAGYGAHSVLHRVSFALRSGTVTGILGPNGSGKSTLLRCLARLLPPSAGSVEFDGTDLFRDLAPRAAARRIALVPQEEAPAHALTVREVVELGRTPHIGRFGWLHRRDRIAAGHAMREMDIHRAAERLLDELSGGERKRAVVARALAQEAGVLLLDEPTAHLDVRHALDLLGLLRRLARRGRTVVIASHEFWQLARGCDRLLLLDRGRLAADGTPRRVLGSRACARAFGVRIRRGQGLTFDIPGRRVQSDRRMSNVKT